MNVVLALVTVAIGAAMFATWRRLVDERRARATLAEPGQSTTTGPWTVEPFIAALAAVCYLSAILFTADVIVGLNASSLGLEQGAQQARWSRLVSIGEDGDREGASS